MPLMYDGMSNRQLPGAAAPVTDGGQQSGAGGGLPLQGGLMNGGMGRVSPWEQQAGAWQSQIRQMEQQLQKLQSDYSMAAIQTNNPTKLASMQGVMKNLEMQIQQARQSAQQWLAMQAMKQQQRSQMPGAGSMGIGRGGNPNQGMTDQSQIISMLSGMFSPSGGSSPYGRY